MSGHQTGRSLDASTCKFMLLLRHGFRLAWQSPLRKRRLLSIEVATQGSHRNCIFLQVHLLQKRLPKKLQYGPSQRCCRRSWDLPMGLP